MSDRRQFLGKMAAVAAAPSLLANRPQAAPRPNRLTARSPWDLSWLDVLAAKKHKAVFDATMIASGLGPAHVDLYLRDYIETFGTEDKDMGAVLVIRHEAVPMLLNDAFWQKYQLGTKLRLNDPLTGAITTRNYFAAGGSRPVPELTTLDQLHARGAIVLGCNNALTSLGKVLAQQAGQPVEAVQAEVRDAVLLFVTLVPSGIFATVRAQEAGCQYIRST